jgi:hypothetical protein
MSRKSGETWGTRGDGDPHRFGKSRESLALKKAGSADVPKEMLLFKK